MKKGIIYFIVTMVGIILLFKFSRGFLSDAYQKWDKLYINKIIAEKKVDLSTFIKDYKEGLFNEIKVINDKTLKGYHFVKTGQAITSMGLREKIIPLEYVVYTTE